MKRRTILKRIGAGGIAVLGASQTVAASSASVQDECVIQCGDPCPRYCDKCLCY